ncbi:hypothetical protein CCHL11_08470 [Colletotrichum chlorophyti]|uniref:Ubiquitin-like domain-containing protein n=1 Tax=Colletotrichum chlorophyti TaxID=708187 RepID=A0A1Q8RQ73_9PEZI|nr:hypothetical protein CCHL11_08470 [Colletotrichum chlorophyti]
MDESLGSTSSSPDVPSIVNLGFQLATKLATYKSRTSHNEDILTTAAALKQLWDFLATDTADKLPLYKDAGRRDIIDLAERCYKVYVALIRIAYRLTMGKKPLQNVNFESVGLEDLKGSRILSNDWRYDPDVTDAENICESQLDWLKSSLLLHVEVVNIVRLQIKSPKTPGMFDEELASRALAMRLLERKVNCAKEIIQEAEARARLAKSDAESIHSAMSASSTDSGRAASADSWDSGETVKTSKPPNTCSNKVGDKKPTIVEVVEPVVALPPPPPPSFWYSSSESAGLGPSDIKLVGLRNCFPAKGIKGIRKWLKSLVGAYSLPALDDVELEATVLQNGPLTGPETFLGYEPETLRREMKNALKLHGEASADPFLVQDPHLRMAVQGALLRAQRKDGRPRQLITVDSTRPDVAIVFMSIEPALEPVHLTDVLGRKIDIPFEQCRILPAARAFIHQRFRDIQRLWPVIRDGCFEIVSEEGTIITPRAWNTTIKPGAVIQMRMSAFNDGINRGRYLPPGAPELLTWAETYTYAGPPRPPGVLRPPILPPGMPIRPRVMPKRNKKPNESSDLANWMACGRGSKIIMTEKQKIGFKLDFGPDLTRKEDVVGCRDLGRWVALWTNATDTDFRANLEDVSSYDTESIVSSSSSSSSELIDD